MSPDPLSFSLPFCLRATTKWERERNAKGNGGKKGQRENESYTAITWGANKAPGTEAFQTMKMKKSLLVLLLYKELGVSTIDAAPICLGPGRLGMLVLVETPGSC